MFIFVFCKCQIYCNYSELTVPQGTEQIQFIINTEWDSVKIFTLAWNNLYLLRHYTIPKNTTIGKCLDASSETMYPNTNFLKFFPETELPETCKTADRSACLRIGVFIVIRKIIEKYHLDEIIAKKSIPLMIRPTRTVRQVILSVLRSDIRRMTTENLS